MINRAPYEPSALPPEDDDSGLRILSICYTTPDTAEDDPQDPMLAMDSYSVCACVSGDGQLDEFITFRKLTTVRLGRNREEILENGGGGSQFMNADKRAKIEDLKNLEAFIERKRPQLIVISTENKDALVVYEDVQVILKRLEERNILGQVGLHLAENEVGRLVSASKLCQADFGNGALPALVKQAITLARYMQDPLLCVSQLFNQDRDILGLKLHPAQQTIIAASGTRNSEDCTRLAHLLEIEFVNKVNEVGVDLNRCNQQPHTAGVLQFVSGLGPRKAQHVLKVNFNLVLGS